MASSSSLDQPEHAQHPSANETEIQVLQDPSANGNDIQVLQDPFVTVIVNILDSNQDIEIPPVSVYLVPEFLSNSKPEAYSPKVFGLGPIFHSMSPLQMDKLGVAKNIHKEFGHIKFQELIQGLVKLVPSIRACYQIYLTDGDSRIACTMAIDSLILFALLCRRSRGKDALTSSDTLRRILNHTDMSRFCGNEIVGDTMMLQNQIPIFVLKRILLMECSSEPLIVEKSLPRLLLGYCKELSPFKVLDNYPDSMALKRTHLLDLLYHLITLTERQLERLIDKEREEKRGKREEKWGKREEKKDEQKQDAHPMYYYYAGDLGPTGVLDILSGLPLPKEVKKTIELIKGLIGLPWSLLLYLSFIGNKAQVVEENLMPTASMLSAVGVKFSPDHISNIMFKRETAFVKLPVIKRKVNLEVIIRNLVAYEIMFKTPEVYRLSVFRGYIKLMCALVKTAEDVKVLRDHDILRTLYMEDKEVAKIFNGIRDQPLFLEQEPAPFDWVIRDINSYYNGLLKVKFGKFFKDVLKLIVTILLWLVVALYLLGSVYGYPFVFEKSRSFCWSIMLVLSKLVSFSTATSSHQLISSGRAPALNPPT